MRNLTNYEKETIILFNDEEKEAECYTCNKSMMNKLDKFCEESKDIILTEQNDFSKTYKFPKKWIKIRKPRELTEEEHQKLTLRAKAMVEKREQAKSKQKEE